MPFTTKQWARMPGKDDSGAFAADAGSQQAHYSLPVDDVNAPDLYIPLMALVSFILMNGLVSGMGMKFHPEVRAC